MGHLRNPQVSVQQILGSLYGCHFLRYLQPLVQVFCAIANTHVHCSELLIERKQLSPFSFSLSALWRIIACRAGAPKSPFVQLSLALAPSTIGATDICDSKLLACQNVAYRMEGLFLKH